MSSKSTQPEEDNKTISKDEIAILGMYTSTSSPRETGMLTLSLPRGGAQPEVTELARTSAAVCGSNPAKIATIRDSAGNLDIFVSNGSPPAMGSKEGYVTRLRCLSDGSMRRIGRERCGMSPSAVMAVPNGLVVACATDGALWSFLTFESFRVCDVIEPAREYGVPPGLRSHLSHAVSLPARERSAVCERFVVCDENASTVSLVRRRSKDGRLRVATWLQVQGPGVPTKAAAGSAQPDVVHVCTKQPPSILSLKVSGATRWGDAANVMEFARCALDGTELISDVRAQGNFLFVAREGSKAGIWRYGLNRNGSIAEGSPKFWATRIVSPVCIAMGEERTVVGLQGGGIVFERTSAFFQEDGQKDFRTIHSLQDVRNIGAIEIVKRSEVF